MLICYDDRGNFRVHKVQVAKLGSGIYAQCDNDSIAKFRFRRSCRSQERQLIEIEAYAHRTYKLDVTQFFLLVKRVALMQTSRPSRLLRLFGGCISGLIREDFCLSGELSKH